MGLCNAKGATCWCDRYIGVLWLNEPKRSIKGTHQLDGFSGVIPCLVPHISRGKLTPWGVLPWQFEESPLTRWVAGPLKVNPVTLRANFYTPNGHTPKLEAIHGLYRVHTPKPIPISGL